MAWKNCIVEECNKEFETYDPGHTGGRGGNKRPSKAKTCSKECSKKYMVIQRVQYQKEYMERKKVISAKNDKTKK